MAHDVFISYASEDRATALEVCTALERRSIRCWMAPRDIRPGADWSGSIVAAIKASRALLLVFSKHANTSKHIAREIDRAIDREIPIVPLRIDDVAPAGALEYGLSTVQWLDAFTQPLDGHIERLAGVVRDTLLPGNADDVATAADDRNRTAFVPGYECDVFVSCERDIDLVWTRRFAQDLRTEIDQALPSGTGVKLVLSGDEAGLPPPSPSAAVFFVALLSGEYRGSQRCMGELELFLATNTPESGRLIQVRLGARVPALFDNRVKPFEMGDSAGPYRARSRAYTTTVRSLADRIVPTLSTLENLRSRSKGNK
jgi:hypothetical protein